MKSKDKDISVKKDLLGSEEPDKSSLPDKRQSRLEKAIHMLNKITHRVSMVILFFMMSLTVVDVVGRYFFNNPITGAVELTSLSMAIIIFFSLGMTQIKEDHISINFLTVKLPMKVEESLNVVTSFVIIILLSLTSWQLIVYAQRFGNQTSGDLGIPMNYFAYLAAIGMFFYTLTILLNMINSFTKVVQKNES
ncbi:TRAP transporter permease DctQ [Salipaludibacillus neizhouensis]|uniref:TRAP transporter permease DctQ n=1 Tax=Salipaludibacillus neizhouensis TaxID=885475 RepID=A0A3A9K1T7_9BACI|nr:TRAP transporter small permease [Salipaludibacillus neizhouensis]RKL67074.1 TRAP transporter permease DctQ [Salipaludibacillus neizhouensis]